MVARSSPHRPRNPATSARYTLSGGTSELSGLFTKSCSYNHHSTIKRIAAANSFAGAFERPKKYGLSGLPQSAQRP